MAYMECPGLFPISRAFQTLGEGWTCFNVSLGVHYPGIGCIGHEVCNVPLRSPQTVRLFLCESMFSSHVAKVCKSDILGAFEQLSEK